MRNVRYVVTADRKLVITVDLDQRFGQSSSGKSEIVASTDGNRKIQVDNIRFGLTVYLPKGNGDV